jgi:hypothetical protein
MTNQWKKWMGGAAASAMLLGGQAWAQSSDTTSTTDKTETTTGNGQTGVKHTKKTKTTTTHKKDTSGQGGSGSAGMDDNTLPSTPAKDDARPNDTSGSEGSTTPPMP